MPGEHFESFVAVTWVSGHGVGELEASGQFGAVELPVMDGGRIPVDVFGIPPPPEGRLAVHVNQVEVVAEDMVDNRNEVGGDARAFGRVGCYEFPHHSVRERL